MEQRKDLRAPEQKENAVKKENHSHATENPKNGDPTKYGNKNMWQCRTPPKISNRWTNMKISLNTKYKYYEIQYVKQKLGTVPNAGK